MPLPLPTEYDDAIQNPKSAFYDSELKAASKDGPLFLIGGIPSPVSGNFAIVYRFRTGTRRLAIKCFTREKTDQQKRYQLIHEHLATQKLPWTIDFTFIKEGIRVKGENYPIVKMEWIENAKTLLSYINDAVSAKQSLDSVCDQFYRMTSDLKKHSIAHGDLQHANLIISDGKLLLIDYDGMCVPKTVGLKSEEDGLQDYQHPRRHGGTLQLSMDHFSTLVIWTSLHALTIDPSLWKRWVRDDERLLFCRADFTRPDNSALIRELLSFRDPKMSSAVEAIVKAAEATSLEQVPHLVEVVTNVCSFDTTPWWKPAVTAAEQAEPPANHELNPLPDWVTSSTTVPLQPVAFKGSTPSLSFYSALSMGVVLITGLLGIGGAVSAPLVFSWVLATLSIYGVVLHVTLLTRPEVSSRADALKKLSKAKADHQKSAALLQSKQASHLKAIADHELKIADSKAKMRTLETAINAVKNQSVEKLRTFARELSEKLNRAEKAERDAVAQSNAKKASAKAIYDSALRQIVQDLNLSEAVFTIQVAQVSGDAERHREAKFAVKFDSFVQSELLKISIGMNPVAGVSTYELNRCGFHTLADFTACGGDGSLKNKSGRYIKVRGIGWVRGSDLVAWRKRMIERIRFQIPAAERDAINHAVEAETRKERERLESIRDQARTKAASAKLHAKAGYDRTLAEAARDENDTKNRAKKALDALVAEETVFKSKVSADEAAELGLLTRELWSLQSVVHPTLHFIKSEQAKMQAETLELGHLADKAHKALDAAKQEVARYAGITHFGLIKYVFT